MLKSEIKMSCPDDMVRRAGSESKDPQEVKATEALTEQDFERMKQFRTTRRRHLTIYCKEISNMVENCGSRRGVSLLLSQAKEALRDGEEYTQLFISRAEEGKEEKDELLPQVHYQQQMEEAKEGYLYERKDDAESEMSERRNPLEHKEETIKVKGQKEDSVGKVEGWIRDNQWRKAPKESEGRTVPDAWIEEYVSGRILPEELIQDGGRPSARVELETYDGKALTWFEWIDMFRCLVHESGRPAGEKLALLKRGLKGPCQGIVYGLGGGDEAYKEALIRLKETCGRRDVMRTVHIKTIDSLEPGRNP